MWNQYIQPHTPIDESDQVHISLLCVSKILGRCKPRFSATSFSILSSTWICHIQFMLLSNVQQTSERKVMFCEYSDYLSHLWYDNWIKSLNQINKTALLKIILLEFQPSHCLILKCIKIYCSMQLQNMTCIRVVYDIWN